MKAGIFLLILCASFLTGCTVNQRGIERGEALRAVHRLLSDVESTIETKNWEEYARLWHHGPQSELFDSATNTELVGWSQLEPELKRFLLSPEKIDGDFSDIRVTVSAGGDMAWATYKVFVTISGEGATSHLARRYSSTMLREDGRWRILGIHGSDLAR